MAPAIREVIQTIAEPRTTDVVVIRRDAKPWPTNTFVTLTWPDSPPATRIAAETTATPTWSYPGKSSGLSNEAKGAIAGSFIGTAFLFLLLYFWCQRPPRSRSAPRSRSKSPKVPPPETPPELPPEPPQDPAADPLEDSAPTPSKKSVSMAPEPPKDPKQNRPIFSPVVKFTTDMTSKTTIDMRGSKRGNPIPFIIRPLERGKS